ncbi:MAG: DbpA RNA binding domain-containing protein [Treponema sp.]|jgi:hypothetical protein|nr:DbpA RNA binding domain-containing protein [Treponema sp.]
MSSQFYKEKTRKTIASILDKIKNETDPQLLNQYRILFKKEVSFFKRSWTAAYLLMLFEQGALGRAAGPKNRKSGEFRSKVSRGKTAEAKSSACAEGQGEQQRYSLDEEKAKRLFISVGRNRRVFPREILGLINSKTSIPRDDIGTIRILDNYSFVQVRDTVADRIIEALNGLNFRGRTLAVNYAKSRKDGEIEDGMDSQGFFADHWDGQESDTGESSPGIDRSMDAEQSEQKQDHSNKEDIDPYSGQQ